MTRDDPFRNAWELAGSGERWRRALIVSKLDLEKDRLTLRLKGSEVALLREGRNTERSS